MFIKYALISVLLNASDYNNQHYLQLLSHKCHKLHSMYNNIHITLLLYELQI